MEKGSIWVLDVTDGEVDERGTCRPRSRPDPSPVVHPRPPVGWTRMRILVTNDDGVDSPGIHALAGGARRRRPRRARGRARPTTAAAPAPRSAGSTAAAPRRSNAACGTSSPTSPCTPSTRRPRPRCSPPASARSATSPTSSRRASTPVRTPATSCSTRARSAPRSPPPGYGIPGIAVSHGVERVARVPLGDRGARRRGRGRVGGQARRRRARPQHQRAQPRARTSCSACARPSSRPPVRCGWRRPTCRRATSRSRSRAAPTPRPAPTSPSSRRATCRSPR